MTYEERAECYRMGAENPEGVKLALEATENFILRFNEACFNNKPDDPGAAEIYRDLVDEYVSDFRFAAVK